ncbi:hypothetical protein IM660_05810 [Ruania alkalisoli]|uniref:Uncharacterized protein n=1 Tax=Ruania alkalisoli TaxID=2779775 RepID=A0A7M1SYF2_9MICO|nr:hypothetical protein [Ruania alkalisoli]QOR71782.1 hypothetical protein IM660_05810 [Ruania alkalisoli]
MEMKNLISTSAINARSGSTCALTMARLRAAAGVIGGSSTDIGANSLGAPAPGSVPDLN